MGNIDLYWHTAVLSARANITNWQAIATGGSLTVARILLYAAIYESAFRSGDAIMSYQNVMWSLAWFFAVNINWDIRHVYFLASEEIETGRIGAKLTRPLSWRLVKVCEVLGGNAPAFAVQLAIMPFILWWRVGLPDTSFWSPGILLGFLVLTVLAVITACASFLTIGLLTFWLKDSLSAYRILDRIVLIAGGGFLPVALMPLVMQWVVRVSPFGPFAAITQLFSPGLGSGMPLLIVFGVLWTAGWIKLNNWVWRKGQQKIGVYDG